MLQDSAALAAMLDSLVVFRGVRQGRVLSALHMFLTEQGSAGEKAARYADFVSALFEQSYSLTEYLMTAVCEDENPYVIAKARGEAVPRVLETCVRGELEIFQKLSALTAEELIGLTGYSGYLPVFDAEKIDFAAEYATRLANITTVGYGIYARHTMFRVENGEIVPVRSPDKIEIDRLIGYERERRMLIDNTEALLAGRPAANTLLCGDAGTGKSTTVKAVANLFASRGLRLIELRKEQLRDIPVVMEKLKENPLKFILFIDDLSFNKNDDTFSSLKAILEGSASVKAPNTVIYATSNRRHLVKETFSDREGDDVHRGDTMQELLSLSERFGLTILFLKPSKALYLKIVHEVCRAKGIDLDEQELDIRASAFALRRGGPTPRAAEQFTDSILAGASGEA